MTREGYERFYREDFFNYLNPFSRPAYVQEIEQTTDDAIVTPTKAKLIPYLLPYVPEKARVLDVGAGFGQVLYLLGKMKGIDGTGLEPDPFSRQIAAEKMGVTLSPETVEEFLAGTHEPYDLIVLNQTFEHLLEPLQTLQGLAKILKPDGVIYIGVPNAWNPQIPMPLFYQVAHTYNYTPHTLAQFAEQAGLFLTHVRDPDGYPLEVIMAQKGSVHPVVSPERIVQGSDWKELKSRLYTKKMKGMIRGLAKKILAPFMGRSATQKLRERIDRLTGYRY
jgi:SAM-dependent methyltransferase